MSKKFAFLFDASIKASNPPSPPRAVSGRSILCKFFYMYKNMFLKQEKPEMDDFGEENTLVLKEKYFKVSIFKKIF